MVPPQPISISSQCAPRQRTRRTFVCLVPTVTLSMSIAERDLHGHARVSLGIGTSSSRSVWFLAPYFPGGDRSVVHLVQLLFVLERIHRRVKAFILVGAQLSFANEASEGLQDQLLSVMDVLENLLLEDEIPAVDSNV